MSRRSRLPGVEVAFPLPIGHSFVAESKGDDDFQKANTQIFGQEKERDARRSLDEVPGMLGNDPPSCHRGKSACLSEM